ncbi:MAG: IS3 family transposase, partial [Leptospiraceae bacterium]|nr:IS3 family transposase [Leptospiraceae bacterium]
VNHMKYQTKEEAKTDLFRYIEVFYNRKRFHSTLGFTSPVNFRLQYKKAA